MKLPGGGVIEVAVKMLAENNDVDKNTSKVKLLQEAAIMGQFLHPNVIKLHGVSTRKDEVQFVPTNINQEVI